MADAVVVTPKPASKSTQILLNIWAIVASVIAAVLPYLLEAAFNALGDPKVASAIANYFPPSVRATILTVVIPMALANWRQRYKTVAPIAGSAAAAAQPLLDTKIAVAVNNAAAFAQAPEAQRRP